ncbi:MAG: hypothetical protein LBC61_07370 [Candidatus Peribacteria bacterium]|nr:hypothetical protein [Candidatus Peribacteria bacterium]
MCSIFGLTFTKKSLYSNFIVLYKLDINFLFGNNIFSNLHFFIKKSTNILKSQSPDTITILSKLSGSSNNFSITQKIISLSIFHFLFDFISIICSLKTTINQAFCNFK